MLVASKKFVAVATLIALSLVGCVKKSESGPLVVKPTAPTRSEPPKFNAASPVPRKATPPFTIEASDGWSLVNYAPLPSDEKEPQLIAIFERDLDEDVSVRAGIIAGNLPEGEDDSYADDIQVAAHRHNAKIFKERIFKLGAQRAYECIEGRMTPTGPQIFLILAVAVDKVGYIVSCGGQLEEAERVLPVCAEFVEGIRFKTK